MLKAQISVDSASGCSPHLCTFSLPQSYNTYSWQFSNGSQSQAASPVLIFEDDGIYSVTVTVNGSQTYTASNLVQVYDSPDPSFTLIDDTICFGDTMQGAISQVNSSSSYQWVLGDGNASSNHQITHFYQTPGSYQVQLNETNAGGCSASSEVSFVQVRNSPNSNFSLSTSKACYDSIAITATASNQVNTIEWYLNGNYVATNGVHSFSNLGLGEHSITLVAQDAYGCDNQNSRSVKQSAPPTFSTWNSGLVGCAPHTISLALPLNTGASVLWTYAGTTFQGDSADIVFQQAGQYALVQTITDSLSCSYTDTIQGIDIAQVDLPLVTFGDSAICRSGWAVFTVNDTNVQSVIWSIADSQRFEPSDSVYLNSPGAYDLEAEFTFVNACVVEQVWKDAFFIESALPMVTLDKEVACASAPYVTRHNNPFIQTPTWSLAGEVRVGDTVHFMVDSVGVFDLEFIASTTTGCSDTALFPAILEIKGDSIVSASPTHYETCDPFVIHLDGGLYGASNYAWDLGDGTSSTDSNLAHVYDELGYYVVSVEAVNAEGCTVKVDSHAVIDFGELNPQYGFEVVNCTNAEVLFYSLSNGGSWIWEIDGDTFTDSAFTTPVNPYAPINVKHIVTNDQGCSGMLLDVNALHLDSCITTYTGDFPAPSQVGGSGNWYTNQPYVNACAPVTVGFEHPEDSLSLVIYDFGNGDTVHATSKINHTFDTADYYDIHLSLIHLNGDTSYRLLEEYVRIGLPQAGFELTSVKGCFGTEVQLTNTSEQASIWSTSFGDGTVSSSMNPSHAYTIEGDYVIRMVAKDTFNCKSTASQKLSVLSEDYFLNIPTQICADDTFYIPHNVAGFDSYTWNIGPYSFSGKKPPMSIPTGGIYPLTLNALDTNACVTALFNGEQIQIYGPEVSLDLGIDSNQCFRVDHTFTASTNDAPNLSWYVNGQFLGNQSTFNLVGDTAGIYSIELVGWQKGCEGVDFDTVYVHAPVADFTVSNNGLCLPQNITFNDLSTSGTMWTWNFGDGGVSNLQNPVHYFDYGHKDSIRLSITDQYGCEASAVKDHIPFHEVDMHIDKTSYCAPSEVIVWDAVGEGQSYDWNLSGSVSSLGDSVVINKNDSGFLSLTLNVAFSSGCTASIVEDSIAFMSRPIADFEIESISGECAPKTVQFSDQSSSGVSQYDWDFGNNMRSSLANPTAVYGERGIYTVELRIIDSLNCRDTVTYDDLLKIEGPKAKFGLIDAEICEGDRVSFLNRSEGSSTYLWVFGDGNSSTQKRGRNQYIDTGSFTVDLFAFDSLGCRDRQRFEHIIVNQSPKPDLALKQFSNCVPARFRLDDTSNGLVEPKYFVFFDDVRLQVDPDIPFQYDQSGDYEVRILIANENGCEASKRISKTIQVFDTIPGQEPDLMQLSVQNDYTLFTAAFVPEHNFKQLHFMKEMGGFWDTLDINTDTSYAYKDALPNAGRSSCYRISLEHYCVTPTALDQLSVYCSIELSVDSITGSKRTLQWNAISETIDIDGYMVQTRRNGQGFITIAEVAPNTLRFIDSVVACPGEQAYRIVAKSINGYADGQSNRSLVLIDTLPVLMQTIDVKRVSVYDEDALIVEWDAETIPYSPLIPAYHLRRTGDDDLFQELSIDVRNGVHIDHKVSTSDEVYRYELVPVNACGLDVGSGLARASLLLMKEQHGNEVSLQWRGYDDLLQDLERFEVQYQDAYGVWQKLKVIDKDTRSTIIDLRELDLDQGQ